VFDFGPQCSAKLTSDPAYVAYIMNLHIMHLCNTTMTMLSFTCIADSKSAG